MALKGDSPFLYRFFRMCCKIYLLIFHRMKSYGYKEHYVKGRAIVAANHLSFLDPPLVGSNILEGAHYLARESLFKKPIMRWILKNSNVHPVSTSSPTKAIKQAAQFLENEIKIVIFPEGTRNSVNEMGEIKNGFTLMMLLSKSPIMPAYVSGTFDAFGRRHKFPQLGKKVELAFGSPILFEDFKHLEKKEFHKAVIDTYKERLHALKEWFENGKRGSPP